MRAALYRSKTQQPQLEKKIIEKMHKFGAVESAVAEEAFSIAFILEKNESVISCVICRCSIAVVTWDRSFIWSMSKCVNFFG